MRRNRSLFSPGTGSRRGPGAGGCAKKEAPAPAPASEAKAPTPAGGGKIPVTTSSAEAKAEFLQGRDMVEKLLITDSIAHFQKAVSLDPNFALAELSLANTAPTGKEFFEHLNKAVEPGRQGLQRREAPDPRDGGRREQQRGQAEGVPRPARRRVPERRARALQSGRLLLRTAGFPKAIEHYKKATEIAPDYSTAYNLLGYAYRQSGDYASAEKAFQKYIELIPKDPNPYDSYAELLLKMGRFDDSIAQYRKALAIDPNFVNAHQGIAMDLLYQGKAGQAAAELQTFAKKARTDGERRTALFARTVVHVDGGKMAKALADVDEQYALGEKSKDVPAMAVDRGLKGNILLEMGKAGSGRARSSSSGLKLVEELEPLAGDQGERERSFTTTTSPASRSRRRTSRGAKTEAEEFRKGAEASKNPAQAKLAHELDGIVALAEKDYDKAIAELQQANQQDPYNLYRLCHAYQGKGDRTRRRKLSQGGGEFNSLPNVNFAIVRTKAKAGRCRAAPA